jgi:hypothetical protein
MDQGAPHVADSNQDNAWVQKTNFGVFAEAHGKWLVAGFPWLPANEAQWTYSLASFLMGANGHSVFDLDPSNNPVPTFSPSMIAAMQLGPALSSAYYARTINGHTIYERDFVNGVAVVNPSVTASVSFSPTPGGTYSGRNCQGYAGSCSTLTSAPSLALGGDGGAVLLRTG